MVHPEAGCFLDQFTIRTDERLPAACAPTAQVLMAEGYSR
jgi:hypothetical protein